MFLKTLEKIEKKNKQEQKHIDTQQIKLIAVDFEFNYFKCSLI